MTRLPPNEKLRFLLNQLRERLWVKPLAICILSIGAAFCAKLADDTWLAEVVPEMTSESIETLLSVMAASMLVIATFAVASMVAAFSSASSAATPRSFPLVISDDMSQNALSTFIGAFIFSIVGLVGMKNESFGAAGRFTLFVLTVGVFGTVIFTFVRWVDRIARLGRLGTTVDKVERATEGALRRRRAAPTLHGAAASAGRARGRAVFAPRVGYVQHVDVGALQAWAAKLDARVTVAALPGTFATPTRPLAFVRDDESGEPLAGDCARVIEAFTIGGDRRFDDDPRFGLVVLAEIAGRALSPAVNDPGTAIDIIGTLVRLLVTWHAAPEPDPEAPVHERVEVPRVSADDMFDDAFTAIARDGAGSVEVVVRLQKALRTLEAVGDPDARAAARRHRRLSLARAERALVQAEDLEAVRAAGASDPLAAELAAPRAAIVES